MKRLEILHFRLLAELYHTIFRGGVQIHGIALEIPLYTKSAYRQGDMLFNKSVPYARKQYIIIAILVL